MGLLNKIRLGGMAAANALLGKHRFLESLRDKYAGQPCFVIGNGPSLKAADLELIKDRLSIASNKIYLIFDQTTWRPNFLTCADPLVWPKIRRELWQHIDCPVIIRRGYVRSWTEISRTYWFTDRGDEIPRDPDTEPPAFSKDLMFGLYGGNTVTYENLQIAAYLGADPICLLGCDHYYEQPETAVNNSDVTVGQEQNHFIANYRVPGEIVKAAPIAAMTLSYQTAQKAAEEHGFTIYNCTRGGHLEVFPRKSLEDVLGSLPDAV